MDASLLLLSWPILLLVANAALLGRRIRWWHALGTIAGFFGAAILVLGLLNTAATLFTWDYAVKHRHVRVPVSLSYLIPLFTALILIGIGASAFTTAVGIACALIFTSAFVSSRKLFMKKEAAV